MCRTATPKANQKPCDRCGKVRNPDDDWEHSWPLSGRIEVLMHSCLPDYLFDPPVRSKDIKLLDDSNVVKTWDYQGLVVQWGNGIRPRRKEKCHSQEKSKKPYHLCCNCHEKFLKLLGKFFFR